MMKIRTDSGRLFRLVENPNTGGFREWNVMFHKGQLNRPGHKFSDSIEEQIGVIEDHRNIGGRVSATLFVNRNECVQTPALKSLPAALIALDDEITEAVNKGWEIR